MCALAPFRHRFSLEAALFSRKVGKCAALGVSVHSRSMNWIHLALATALAFAAYNVFIKLASSEIDHVMGAVVLQVVAALMGGAYLVILKASGRELLWSGRGVGLAALAGLSVGLAEILTFVVFSRGAPAALATPIFLGGSTLVTAVVGIALLGERVGATQLAGIGLVALGITLLSR